MVVAPVATVYDEPSGVFAPVQLLTEKGAHIKAKRDHEQLTAEHAQLGAELDQLRKDLAKSSEDLEAVHQSELGVKMELERVSAELKAVTLDRDRLMREGIEMEAREATLKEQLQVSGGERLGRDIQCMKINFCQFLGWLVQCFSNHGSRPRNRVAMR